MTTLEEQGEWVEDLGYNVHIPANIYAGKYYDYQTVPYFVSGRFAKNEQEAVNYVNHNKERVLIELDKKRMMSGTTSKRYVKMPATQNTFFKSTYMHVKKARREYNTKLAELQSQ